MELFNRMSTGEWYDEEHLERLDMTLAIDPMTGDLYLGRKGDWHAVDKIDSEDEYDIGVTTYTAIYVTDVPAGVLTVNDPLTVTA